MSDNKAYTPKRASSARKKQSELMLNVRSFGSPLLPIFLTLSIFWCEIIFKISAKIDFSGNSVWYLLLFSVPFAMIIYALSTFFSNLLINKIVLYVLTGALGVFYNVQFIYMTFFGYYLKLIDMQETSQVINSTFIGNIISSIGRNFLTVIAFFLPLVIVIIFRKSIFCPRKTTLAAKTVLVVIGIVIQSILVGAILATGSGETTDRHFYSESYEQDIVAQRFGVLTMTRLEIKYTFKGTPEEQTEKDDPADDPGKEEQPIHYDPSSNIPEENEVFHDTPDFVSESDDFIVTPNTISKEDFEKALPENAVKAEAAVEGIVLYKIQNGSSVSYTAAYKISEDEYQKVQVVIPQKFNGDTSKLEYQYSYNHVKKSDIVYGYNVLSQIDFEKLIANETNQNIKKLHKYFASVEPTKKNEYTGMFKGKNLIFMTCESFCPWFIDKDLTPALYRLYTEGFRFNNFYVSEWAASTGGGEFSMQTGLAALKTLKDIKGQLMPYSSQQGTYLPTTPGNIFRKAGYTALSYHDHKNNMYEREKAHKLWGYDYSYIGHGIDMTYVWPCSDDEMIKATVDKYIDKTPFIVDYMTISAHGDYSNWTTIAKKNKAKVESMKWSDTIKIYIAESLELEYAMQTLLERLEQAGILDDTVIVMAPDHWPYCLDTNYGVTNEELSEFYGFTTDTTFERYHNGLIIWSASMKKPVVVDKVCSSVDIVPTVLNLFGADYDSRLYSGRDILSDSEGVAMTAANKSWVSDLGRYKTGSGFTANGKGEATDEYIKKMTQLIKDRVTYSNYIVLYDYYKVLWKEAGLS